VETWASSLLPAQLKCVGVKTADRGFRAWQRENVLLPEVEQHKQCAIAPGLGSDSRRVGPWAESAGSSKIRILSEFLAHKLEACAKIVIYLESLRRAKSRAGQDFHEQPQHITRCLCKHSSGIRALLLASDFIVLHSINEVQVPSIRSLPTQSHQSWTEIETLLFFK
jgi:hypothetical protein